MCSAGQLAVPVAINSAAALGEAGSCGNHHVMWGNCAAMTAATCRALVDWGDERNPCKYSTWVVVKGEAEGVADVAAEVAAEGALGKVMPNAISGPKQAAPSAAP